MGGSFKTSAITAALVNGTLDHGDEIDESTNEAGHVAAIVAGFDIGLIKIIGLKQYRI
jgi:hypothetical protein